MIFRKDEWALRRLDGRRGSMGQSPAVVLTSSLLSCDASVFVADETP